MVQSVLRRGPLPTEGFPPMATAVPVTVPTLPPLPGKASPMPAAVKPITPDSPDIRDPGQDLIRQSEEDYRPSDISQAGSHRGQGVSAQGFGLPPIPAAHSAGSPPIPKGRVGKGGTHSAPKAPGVSSTRGKHSMKSKGSRPPNIESAGARSTPAPGWNADFSVQHSDPVSIKDQERHMSKKHQGSAKQSQIPSGRTALQPPGGQSAATQHGPAKQASSVGTAAVASRAHKPPAVPWTHQACRPPAAYEPHGQCGGTVYMKDDWECSLPSEQIGCSSVHSRNLDSAQSPLRPLKGEHGGSIGFCGQAQLDKASFSELGIKVSMY